jgi:chromate reductase
LIFTYFFRGKKMALKKFIGISGSLRKKSTNTGLLRAIQKLGPKYGFELTILNYSDVPMYDQDTEDWGNPDSVEIMRMQVLEADGLVFACPEYNGYFSGALKNLIDWGTRKKNIWADKRCLIVSAGGGGGGIRGCKQLAALLTDIKASVMPDGADGGVHLKIFEPPSPVDMKSGNVIEGGALELIENTVEEFSEFVVCAC